MTTNGAEVAPEVQQTFDMSSPASDGITTVTDHMIPTGNHMTYRQSYTVDPQHHQDEDGSETGAVQKHNVNTSYANISEGESTPEEEGGGDTVPYESTTTDTIPEAMDPIDFIENSPPKYPPPACLAMHNGRFTGGASMTVGASGRGGGGGGGGGGFCAVAGHKYENWSIDVHMKEIEDGGRKGVAKTPKRMKLSRVARVDRQRTPYPLPRGSTKTKPVHARPSPSSRKRRLSGRLVRAVPPPPVSNASEEGDMAQADEMGEGEGRDFGFVDGPDAVKKRNKKRTTGGVHMLLPAMGSGSPPSSPSNTPVSRRRTSSRKARPKPRSRKANKVSLASADVSTQETTTPGPGSSDTSDESVSNDDQGLPRHGDDVTVSDDDDDLYEDARSPTPNFPPNPAHSPSPFPRNTSSPHNQTSNGIGLNYRKPGQNASRFSPLNPPSSRAAAKPESAISKVPCRDSFDPQRSNSEENSRLDSSDTDVTSLSHASSPPLRMRGPSQLRSNRRLESDLSTAPFSSETSDLDTSGNERLTSKNATKGSKNDKTERKSSPPFSVMKTTSVKDAKSKGKVSPPLAKKNTTALNHSASSGDDTSKGSRRETKPASGVARPPVVGRKPVTTKPIAKPLPPPPPAKKPSSQQASSSISSSTITSIPNRPPSIKTEPQKSSKVTSSTSSSSFVVAPKTHSPRPSRPISSTAAGSSNGSNSSGVKPPLRNKSAGNLLPSKPKPPVAAKPVKPEVKPKRTSLPVTTSGGNGVTHRYGKQLSSGALANNSSSVVPRLEKRSASVDVAIEGNIAGRILSKRSEEAKAKATATKSPSPPGIRKNHSDTDLVELRKKKSPSPPRRLAKLHEVKEPESEVTKTTAKEQRSSLAGASIPIRPSVPTRPRKQASEKKIQVTSSLSSKQASHSVGETPASVTTSEQLKDVQPLSTTSQSDSSNKSPSSSEATSGQSQSPSVSPYASPSTRKKKTTAALLPQKPTAPSTHKRTKSTKAEPRLKQPSGSSKDREMSSAQRKTEADTSKAAPSALSEAGTTRSSGYARIQKVKSPKLPPREPLKNSKTSSEANTITTTKPKDEDAPAIKKAAKEDAPVIKKEATAIVKEAAAKEVSPLSKVSDSDFDSGAASDDEAPPIPPRNYTPPSTLNRKSTHFELSIPVLTSDPAPHPATPLSPPDKEPPPLSRKKKLSSPRRPPPSPPREWRKSLDEESPSSTTTQQGALFSSSVASSQISTISENYEVCDRDSILYELDSMSEMSLSPLANMFATQMSNAADFKVVGQNVDALRKEALDLGRSRTPDNLISECSKNEETIVDSKKGSDSELEVGSSKRSTRRKLKPSNSKRRVPPKPPKASGNASYVMVDLDFITPKSPLESVAPTVVQRSPDQGKESHDQRRSDTSLSSMSSSARDDSPPPIPSQPIPSKKERLSRMLSTPSPGPNRSDSFSGGETKPSALEHVHRTLDYTKSLCIPPQIPVSKAVKRDPIYEVIDTFKSKKEPLVPTSQQQQQQQQQQQEKSGYSHITLPLERDRDQILPNKSKEDSPPTARAGPATTGKLAMEDIRENWKKSSPVMLRRKQAKSFSAKSQSLMYRRSTSNRVHFTKVSTFDPAMAKRLLQRTSSVDRLDDRMDHSTRNSMHTRDSSSEDEEEEEDNPVVMSPPAPGLPRPPQNSLYSSPRQQHPRRPIAKSASAFMVSPDDEPLYQYINTAEFLSVRGAEVKSAGPNRSQLEIARQLSSRRLWCEQAEIIQSGVLDSLSDEQRKLQEAIFEVITTEETYLRSLDVLLQHFKEDPGMNPNLPEGRRVLDKRQHHVIFSNLLEVRDISSAFLEELQGRQRESAVVKNIADIVLKYAENSFDPYIHYCTNQIYQTRELQECIENNVMFREYLKRLESHKRCQALNMQSFLLLPMQRITRLPLLILAIINRTPLDHPDHQLVENTLRSVQKLVTKCNDGARKMERTEQLHHIHQRLDFGKLKPFPLVSVSRQLERKGTLYKLKVDQKLFGRHRIKRKPIYLFVFTDYIIITKRKKDPKGDYIYRVVDHASRAVVEVSSVTCHPDGTFQRPPVFGEHETPFSRAVWAVSAAGAKHAFLVTFLDNAHHKSTSYTFIAQNDTDMTRWMEAIVRQDAQREEEKIYEHWDCPQVQAIYDYEAKQPDELDLQRGDVVKVFRKMADGWYEGERLRDLQWGWFPSNFTAEIENEHTRARNLRETHKLRLPAPPQLTQSVK